MLFRHSIALNGGKENRLSPPHLTTSAQPIGQRVIHHSDAKKRTRLVIVSNTTIMEVRNHNTTHHQCSPPPRLDDLQKSHGAIKEDSFASLPMLLRHSNDNEIDKEEHSNRTFITRLMDNSISAPSLIFDPEESLSGHEDAFHFAFEVVRQVEGPSYDAKDL